MREEEVLEEHKIIKCFVFHLHTHCCLFSRTVRRRRFGFLWLLCPPPLLCGPQAFINFSALAPWMVEEDWLICNYRWLANLTVAHNQGQAGSLLFDLSISVLCSVPWAFFRRPGDWRGAVSPTVIRHRLIIFSLCLMMLSITFIFHSFPPHSEIKYILVLAKYLTALSDPCRLCIYIFHRNFPKYGQHRWNGWY